MNNSSTPKKRSPLLSNPRFARAFARDANKAIDALQEAFDQKDIKRLTSTFHAMKSALAGVGEHENSAISAELERAGLNEDMELISSKIDSFIQILKDLIPEDDTAPESEVAEDTAFIKLKLEIIKTACENYYDIELIDSEFKLVLEKVTKTATRTFVERIRDLLYSDSDFDGVAEKIEEFLKDYN